MNSTYALAKAGVARMSHVSIDVADIGRARQFYETIFGFRVVMDRELSGPELEKIIAVPGARSRMIRGLIAGNSVVQLFWHSWRTPAPLAGLMSFEVRDIAAAYATLQDAGVPCVSSPVEFDNSWAFVLHDPDGNAIELIQWKPEADPYTAS